MGSLTGAVASQRVTEAYKGRFNLVNNQVVNIMVKICLTVRRTRQTETKVGHSDPMSIRGHLIAQRIKGTPGITG
jgi:hypothetical protein